MAALQDAGSRSADASTVAVPRRGRGPGRRASSRMRRARGARLAEGAGGGRRDRRAAGEEARGCRGRRVAAGRRPTGGSSRPSRSSTAALAAPSAADRASQALKALRGIGTPSDMPRGARPARRRERGRPDRTEAEKTAVALAPEDRQPRRPVERW
ncbi:MAG: hypothetical protein MZW92_40360 [Comamonadaceae bacterium]|nr:hypothetical protein [Comamonadaceae bacterium]